MANLTRIKVKPPATARPVARTKVLLVRQPAKSAHRVDHPSPTPTNLFIGIVVALGVVGTVWLMGFLGYRLGFAPLMRVRELLAEPSGGLATGTIMLISMPRVILTAGMDQTMGLMLAFCLIGIPGAGLAAVRSYPAGGPRLPKIVTLFSNLGAAMSALNGVVLIWWTGSGFRNSMVNDLPFDVEDGAVWLNQLEIVSGLDVLAVVAAACWVVLVMKLTIPIWLKALSTSFALFTLLVVTVAMSMSNATVAQITTPRSVYLADSGMVDARLLLGSTRNHYATMRIEKNALDENKRVAVVELIDLPGTLTIIESLSIIEFLETNRPVEQR